MLLLAQVAEQVEQAVREASRQKDEQIAALEEAVRSLRSGLDLDLLQAKNQLDERESERLQLCTKVSVLQAEMEERLSAMARRLADKEEELRELAESKASLLAKYEKENKDLAEETEHLLNMMSRMRREKEVENQEVVQTMHGALRAKEEEVERLRERVGDADRDLQQALRDLSRREQEVAALQEALTVRGNVDDVVSKKDAELNVLNLVSEALKVELRQLKDAKELEVGKLKKTVETLKAELFIQKELLLTFHEGRAYLGAPSDHDHSTARVIRGLRNTTERVQLPEDGDHMPAIRPRRKVLFPGDVERGIGLKRTASEGDHLDIADLLGIRTPSDMSFSFSLGSRTWSNMSTTSSMQAARLAAPQGPEPPAEPVTS